MPRAEVAGDKRDEIVEGDRPLAGGDVAHVQAIDRRHRGLGDPLRRDVAADEVNAGTPGAWQHRDETAYEPT